MDLRLRTVIPLCALAFAAGCNGDVFIDEFLPEDMEVEVGTDSPKAVVMFDSGNWDILSVRNSVGGAMSGDIIYPDGTSVSGFLYGNGMVDLHYDDGLLDFSIGRHDSRSLEIVLNENMLDYEYPITLFVGNNYESRKIVAAMHPSPDYRIDDIEYDWSGFEYHDNVGETVDRVTVENSGDTEMEWIVYPFEKASRKVHFRVNDDPYQETFRLFRNSVPEVPVPDVADSIPYMGDSRSRFAYEEQYLPVSDGLEAVRKVISVGPHERLEIETVVIYEQYSVPYTIYLSNPGTGRHRTVDGWLTSRNPYDFVIILPEVEE